MTVQSRILRSLARAETVLDFGRPADLGEQLAAARLSVRIGRQAAPLDLPATDAAARQSGGGENGLFLATNNANQGDNATLELDGVSSILAVEVGGFDYAVVTGADDDGISVFRINADGTLTPVFDVTDAGALELDGARHASTAMVDGNTYIFVTGQADNGISVFRVGTNGSLTSVANVNDDAAVLLGGAYRSATATIGTTTYLYVAGSADDGITIFRVAGDGRLTHLGNVTDASLAAHELDGASGLLTVRIGANTFLVASGNVDDGISVFQIGAGGLLTHIGSVTDSGLRELDGAIGLATAVVGGITYIYASGYDDDGISVFSMTSGGVLASVQDVTDNATARLDGVYNLSVMNFGGAQYLAAAGVEGGITLYRIMAGGVLEFADNLLDTATLRIGGDANVTSANVGGETMIVGGSFVDDGVSVLGSEITGQVWYSTEGNLADARIGYFNTDGFNHLDAIDNSPTTDLITGFVEAVVIDSAAGRYWALVTGNEGINARLITGIIGSVAAPTVVFTFDPTYAGSENNLTFHLDINPFTETIYVGFINFNPFTDAGAGIRQFTYNTTTGAVSGGTFLVTETTAQTPPSTAGADGLFASQDMAFDTTRNVFYSQNLALGDGFETNTILRFSLTNPGGAAGVSVINQAQFPLNGNGSDFTTLNGIIADIEIDEDSNRLYFLTRAEDVEENTGEDAIWMIANASTAVNATATKLTLVGITQANFYPEDMTLDEVNNILYVESENSNLVGGGISDVILVFQLDSAGTTATLINTIDMAFGTTANIEGMHFNHLVTMGALTATGLSVTEQSTAVDLLNAAPTIADFDGDHLASATVQITGGTFDSNENSFNDDDLGHGSGMTQSGLIAGTNITISWNQATGTLTLTGYDTFANYQAALNNIHFQSTGNNPTNYGLNTFRTITWTVSDGLANIPGGQRNSGTTTVNIIAVNDGPTNTVPGAQVIAEDSVLNLAGLSIADPDLNPAITDIVVTLTATNGTLTLLTNVAGGLIAADIANNGTGVVTITATRNEINATFAALGGLVFLNTPDYNGSASVQIVTNDGGNTGTGGALSDTDTISITVNAVVDIANDAPSFAEDSGGGAQTIDVLANDTFENAARFISSVTQGLHGVVTIVDGPDADGIMDYVVYTQVGDYNGTDSFTYTVTSGGVTEVATVNVTITAVVDIANDAPSFAEDSGAQTIDEAANDTFENAARFISSVTQGLHGVVTIVDGPDADGIMDYVVYTQVADYNGTDSFTYTVTSGGVTEVATVNLTITAVADIADDNVTVAEDSGTNSLNGIGNISLLANDSFENAGRAITAVGAALHGTTAINNNGTAGDATDDYVTYTPTGNYAGPDSFTYTVTSGGVTETATVNVNVTAVNDGPINTKPGTQTINEDATLTFNAAGGNAISISDIDAAPGLLTVTLAVVNGQLTLSGIAGLSFGAGDGTDDTSMTFTGTAADINAALNGLLYETTLDFNGTDTLTITTNDNGNTGTPGALQDIDTVTINVTAVADIANDTVNIAEDAGATQLNLLANDTFENPGRSITSVTQGLHGFVSINDNNTVGNTTDDYVVYTAAADYNGTDSFTYTVTSGGVTEAATVNVNISPVVDIANDTSTVGEDSGATTIDVIANDSFENGGFSITAVTQGLHGTVTIIDGPDADLNPDYVTYTPNADYNGADSFTYTVTSGGVTETATVYVKVSAVADIADDSVGVIQDSVGNVLNLLANDTFENAGRGITAVGAALHGTVTINNNGTPGNITDDFVTYTPTGGYIGPDSFTYTVTSGGVTETATVSVNVVPANERPVVDLNTGTGGVNDTGFYVEGGTNAAIGLAISVTDAEGDNVVSATITITDPEAGDLLFANLPLPGGITIDAINSTATTLILIGSASAATYATALGQVGFTSSSQDPTDGGTNLDRVITVTASDAGGAGPAATMTLTITGVNDEPTLIATGASQTLTEGGAALDLFSAVTASTVEGGQTFSSMTLTVTNVSDGADEVLFFNGSNVALTNGNAVTTATNGLNVTVTVAAGTATVTFSGATLSATQLQTLVDGLTYINTSQDPTDGDRTITLTQIVDSGSNTSPNDNVTALAIASTVNVDPVNDGPGNTVPGTQAFNEGGSVTFSNGGGNAIVISDPDANPADVTVTLTIADGALTLNAGALAALTSVTGNGTNNVVLSGTVAEVNAALDGLVYVPPTNANGGRTLNVLTSDNGNSPAPVLTDSDNITININSVNDAPAGADNTVSGSEDDPYVFTAADFGFSDPVEGNAFFAVRIMTFPANGTLFLDSDGPGGAAPVDLSTVGPGVYVSITDINAGELYFQPDPDEFGNGYATFTFAVQDDGGTTNGGQDTDQSPNTMTINIAQDNAPPAVDLDSGTGGVNYTASYTEDAPGVAIGSGVTVTDPNSGTGDMIESATIVLTDRVAGDSLTISGALPPGIIAVTTPTAGAITIQITGPGTGAQYQALIQSILYATTSQDPTVGGTDPARTITVTVNDGTISSAVATTTVNITAVNDAAVAQPDSFTITESGSIVAGNLFANNGSGADSDPDGPPLAVSAVNGSAGNVGTVSPFTLPSGASLQVFANGTFNYNPNTAFLPTPTAGSGASNTPGHDSFTYTLAGGNTVTVSITLTGLDTNDILIGTAGVDVLIAGVGSDFLDGLAGADTMSGNAGNDIYVVDNGGDVVIEQIGEGQDIVYTSVNYALGAGSAVETLSAVDHSLTSPLALFGNEFANTILGNSGGNLLDGGAGADVMVGFGGNDVFVVDNGGDQVIESVGGGTDIVYARVNYALAAGVSVETLSAADHSQTIALALFGNAFGQTLLGNAGANYLDGGGGADVMVGFGGNDVYVVDNAADFAFEALGQGVDTVYALTSYALGAGTEIETLSVTDHSLTTAINLTGNEYSNAVLGNSGANIINGGLGTDYLYGFGGADSFVFNTTLGNGNVDVIYGYDGIGTDGDDVILLDDAVFTGMTLGSLDPGAFVAGTAALDANDRIIYDTSTGALYFDADGSGAGAQVLFAVLDSSPALAAGDFTVI